MENCSHNQIPEVYKNHPYAMFGLQTNNQNNANNQNKVNKEKK